MNVTQREREIWQACDDLISIGKQVSEITGEAVAVGSVIKKASN